MGKRRLFHPPAELSDVEWQVLDAALERSMYRSVVVKMRAVHNKPQRACDVLPAHTANQGNDIVNMILHAHKLPYRFTRVEPWTGADNRLHRKLAFVRWPVSYRVGEQLPLPL